MLAEIRKIKAKHKADLCDIAAITTCTPEYHEKLRGMFAQEFTEDCVQYDVTEEEPVSLDGVDAQNAMKMIFSH